MYSMENEKFLEGFVAEVDNLPTLPGIAIKILEALQKKDPDIDEINEILSADPPLCAKVLKLVNSSFYNLPQKIGSVRHGIKLLGIDTVKNLALSFSLIHNYQPKQSNGFDYTLFWKNSLIGAISAKLLIEESRPRLLDNAFFMGLLQNIGTLTFGHCMPDRYRLVQTEIDRNHADSQVVEDCLLGYNHQEVGEYLMKSWGLPENLYVPVGYHHNPEKLRSAQSDIQILTRVLHLSSLFIDLFNNNSAGLNLWLLNHRVGSYGLGADIDVGQIAEEIQRQSRQIFPIFEIGFESDAEFVEIYKSAKSELSKLSTEMVDALLEQKNEIHLLKQQVYRDSMTRLFNHQHFLELLCREISRAKRYNNPLSLIMGDIDNFKLINDTYGHLTGDRVIKTVAGCLQQEIRESDHAARYGGEEFAVILPEAHLQEAYVVAERIRQSIDSLRIGYEKEMIHFTMSFGIVSFQMREGITANELIKRADSALYQAKIQGRNQCCVLGDTGDLFSETA